MFKAFYQKQRPYGASAAAAVAATIFFGAAAASADEPDAGSADRVAIIRQWALHPGKSRSLHAPSMGAEPSDEKDFGRSPRFQILPASRGGRPARLLLTEYLPPVADQGGQGSCVGWSTAYYNYTYGVAMRRKLTPEQIADPKFRFSPAFIYHLGNKGKDAGMTLYDAFTLLQQKGCATLAEMPYNEKDYTSPPDDAANSRANRYRAKAIGSLFSVKQRPTMEGLKTFLAETRRPFVAIIAVFKDFPMGSTTAVPENFIYNLTLEPKKVNFVGCHAVTIVGYDDNLKAFRMVNSWGPGWGDRGFLWLSEEFVMKYCLEGWADRPGGIGARGASVTPHVILEPAGKRTAPGRGKPGHLINVGRKE